MTTTTTAPARNATTGSTPSLRAQPPGSRSNDMWTVRVPLVGTFALSTPELIYVGGLTGLAAFGLLEWPIGLALVGGHLLVADRSSRAAQELGEAMTEADG